MPALQRVGKLIGRRTLPLADVADRAWTLSPTTRARRPKAFFLPDQLGRVTGTMFSDRDPATEVAGGLVDELPTRALVFEHAWLVDGVLYKGRGCEYLSSRTRRIPRLRVEDELTRGAVYSTAAGIQYFGNWLLHDCVTYPLAVAEGEPLTIERTTVGPHEATYEEWLGMRPARRNAVFLHELVVFDDVGYTDHKRARFAAMREKLLSRVDAKPHPGVFILRGRTGQGAPRVLENELAIADMLVRDRGFRVVDTAQDDAPTILGACAGARVVAGVEGSGLAHGIVALAPGGSLLTLQPPDRFVTVLKDAVEREHQHFAFVVGRARGAAFHVDPVEVQRTLDLLPPARV